jgi:mannose-6-phosphate isomerase
MICRMANPVQRYAWGSVEAIPRLLGVPPDGEPQAELWLGAHERAASRVQMPGVGEEPVSLLDVVARDPLGELGESWSGDGRMPFLAKVIATGTPLSLQVHPDAEKATRWYAEEERRGLDPHLDTRTCPDDVAKAEMVLALTEFRALCGFRHCAEAVDWLEALDVAALKPTAESLRRHGREALRDEVARLLRLDSPADAVAALRARAEVLESDPRWGRSAQVVQELAALYPSDPAVAMALLLEPFALQPGEAMFVRPGQPHCYLSGTAFEVQANSDNVLRAGLTSKHVDVDLLLEALDTTDSTGAGSDAGVAAIAGVQVGDEQVFAPDTSRFALSVLRSADGVHPLPVVPGPQVLLCLDGEFTAADAHRPDAGGGVVLCRGESAYTPASAGPLRVRGSGRLLRVTTGRAGRALAGGPLRTHPDRRST